jgi:hypothetical protein
MNEQVAGTITNRSGDGKFDSTLTGDIPIC